MLAQRKCQYHEEIGGWVREDLGNSLENYHIIVGVFGNTEEKHRKFRLRLKDKGCFAGFRALYLIKNNLLL
jgi:hypothetical protein